MGHLLKMKIALLLAGGIFVCAITANGAQQNNDRPADRAEFQQMMEAYVLSKLQDALGLSDEQYAQMVVAQKKLHDARRSHRRERQRLLRQLHREVDLDDADERLAATIAELSSLDESHRGELRERIDVIDQILSVRQQAKYRLLEVELERRMQRLIQGVRQRRRGAEGPRTRR